MRLSLLLGLAVGWLLAGPLMAADPVAGLPETVSYHQDIRPIFQQHCQGCHQPAKRSGNFLMHEFKALFAQGDSEQPGIVPGKPDESLIMELVSGDQPAMPKERDPLPPREVALIRKWIEQGAKDDSPPALGPVVDQDHPPLYTLPPVLTSVQFSPDGQLLAVSGYHEVLLHKADGSELVARLVGLSERIESAVFSPDGKHLAVTGGSPGRFGEVQIWDVPSRSLTLSLPVCYDTLYGASWSHDGKLVAFGCPDNTVRAIEAATGKQVLFQGAHDDWVLDTTFSKDSSHLISVSRDRSMKLTEVATERFMDNITSITPGALKGGLISVVTVPGQDQVVVGGADGVPKLYQIYRTQARKIGDDFNLIRKFPAMPGRIFAVDVANDGSFLVAGSSHQGQGEVRIFNLADAKEIARCEGEQGAVYAVDIRPDGKVVASAGFDGKVRLNDAQTGKLIGEFVPVPLSTQTAGN